MVDNVGAVQPSGTFQYIPSSGIGYSGFDDFDMEFGSYPMGMGGSIFSGTGMPYMMPGIGGGMDIQAYFDQMKQYQSFYGQYNLELQKRQRNADLLLNGSMESIEECAQNLKDKIDHNEQDQIIEAYRKYVDSIRRAYGEGNEEDINSRAMTTYRRLMGKSLVQDLRDNGHSSFVQGVFQSLSFGLFSQKSSEDNIAEITGQTVHQGEKVEQNIGRVVGAIGAGVAGTTILAFAKHHSATIARVLKKVPMVSFVVAGLAAGLAFMTGKATT